MLRQYAGWLCKLLSKDSAASEVSTTGAQHEPVRSHAMLMYANAYLCIQLHADWDTVLSQDHVDHSYVCALVVAYSSNNRPILLADPRQAWVLPQEHCPNMT